MTIKPFLRFLAAFVLLYFFMIATIIAATKWKDEVGIASWCYDLGVLDGIAKAVADGNPEVADALATQAFKEHDCVQLPMPAAAFRPSGIAAKYSGWVTGPVTVVKGNLVMKDESLGRVVYVVVPDRLVSTFQMTGPVDSRPTPGVQYQNWQDI
jgi:hypothetical protein